MENDEIELEKLYYVYVVRRPIWTGDLRYYIGVSSTKRDRWRDHLSASRNNKKNNTLFYNWMSKYNDCFFEILMNNLSEDEAYEYEKEMVPENSIERKILGLMNSCGGGRKPPKFSDFSEEKQLQIIENNKKALNDPKVKKKMSGDNHWTRRIGKEKTYFFGKKGEEHPCYGKTFSKERLEKVSGENHWNYGNKGANCKTSKPVRATNVLTGETKDFCSALEACNPIDGWATNHGHVINCCKKRPRYKTHKGCTWEYINNGGS